MPRQVMACSSLEEASMQSRLSSTDMQLGASANDSVCICPRHSRAVWDSCWPMNGITQSSWQWHSHQAVERSAVQYSLWVSEGAASVVDDSLALSWHI
eukprot:365192-Chlamydomonas_euryale.AAC.31